LSTLESTENLTVHPPPPVSVQGTGEGDHLSLLTNPRTHGTTRSDQRHRAAEESNDEDHVEEIFGQVWLIPHSPEKARVLN
jgi:hypothetical protein